MPSPEVEGTQVLQGAQGDPSSGLPCRKRPLAALEGAEGNRRRAVAACGHPGEARLPAQARAEQGPAGQQRLTICIRGAAASAVAPPSPPSAPCDAPTVRPVEGTPRSTDFVALGHAGSEHYAGLETFDNPGVSHVEMTS